MSKPMKQMKPIQLEQVSQILNQDKCMEIIQGLYQGKPLLGPTGLLTSLVKDFTQFALQGEMDAHLLENSLEQGNNRRNGIVTKTMKTATGSFELETPRDRNGSFEPQLIKKRQTILNEECAVGVQELIYEANRLRKST
jgi:hypothetical protein